MEHIEEIKKIFSDCADVKLAYFFGSRASGGAGPQSDYDFAVYLDTRDRQKAFDVKLELMGKLTRALLTDKVDVVVLDTSEKPDLKYNIIKDGQLIHEIEPFRVMLEPKILHEYFDFNMMLERNGLTRNS